MDPDDEAFEAVLASQRGARRTRFRATVERLREIGLPIDAQVDPTDLESDDALGRPTIARALVAAGYAESVEDAFQRFIGHGRPGYAAANRPRPRRGDPGDPGGRRPRVARPLPARRPARLALLRELMDDGLDGLEIHHRSFDGRDRASRRPSARGLGLVETGGSDYHGDLGPYAETHALLVLPESWSRACARPSGGRAGRSARP